MASSMRVLALLVLHCVVATLATKPLCRETYSGQQTHWRDCRVQIGGLAIQGAADFDAQLGPTFRDYLTERLNATMGLEFESIPLNFDQNFEYVQGNMLDFIYSNPAAYTCLMVEFGVSTVASLLNLRKGYSLEKFAGVIFSRNGSSFRTIQDLHRARVEAVSISGLGAMQLQQAELLKLGFDVMTDPVSLIFAYNQNKIVQDVESGYADVGFVRTDMIDRSVAAGNTKWEYFQVINEISDATFPFKRSTDFTPEWPVGAMPHVPFEIQQAVGEMLWDLDSSSSDPLLKSPTVPGKFSTWVAPMNYLGLLEMLKDIGYYSEKEKKCLRSADVYAAVQCPPGYVKQSPDKAFCTENCKPGYDCLCRPCTKLEDPALVLTVDAVNTTWAPNVDVDLVDNLTVTEPSCNRMGRCLTAAVGQNVRWELLDRIGSESRAQINAPLLDLVEMRLGIDADWVPMNAENATLPNGLSTERYWLESTADAMGAQIVQIRINGEQADMSPVVVQYTEKPKRVVVCPSGHRENEDGLCEACPPGTSGTIDTSTGKVVHVCRLCLKGTYQPNASQPECLFCPSGQVTPYEGSVTCMPCLEGSSTLGREGRAVCEACEPGQQAPGRGQERCAFCPRGTYSDTEGSSKCTACRSGTTTQDVGSRNATSCGCPEGFYMGTDKAGVAACRSCPTPGTTCAGFGAPPLVTQGFFMDPAARRDEYPLDLWRCQSEKVCAGQLQESDSICVGSLSGLNCAKCSDGTFRSNDGTCKKCSISGGVAAVFVMAMLIIGFTVVGVLAYRLSNKKKSVIMSVVGGLFLTLLQTISVFNWLKVDWPINVKWMFQGATMVLLDVSEFQTNCWMQESAASSYVVRLMLPVLGGISILLWRPTSMLLHKLSNERFAILTPPSLANVLGAMLQALFISIVSASVSLLDCYKSPNNKEVVRTIPYTVCWVGVHNSMLPLAALALIVYVLGFLAVLVLAAWKAPDYYDRQWFRDSFDFLFFRYKSSTWWFGIVVLVRSTMLAMATVLAPDDAFTQFQLVSLTLLFGLVMHLCFMPYKDVVANFLEGVQLVLLIMMICFGSWFLNDARKDSSAEDKTFAQTLSNLIVACIVIDVLVLCSGTMLSKGLEKAGISQQEIVRRASTKVLPEIEDDAVTTLSGKNSLGPEKLDAVLPPSEPAPAWSGGGR